MSGHLHLSSSYQQQHSVFDSDDIGALLERMLALCAAVSGTVGYALVEPSVALAASSSPGLGKIGSGTPDCDSNSTAPAALSDTQPGSHTATSSTHTSAEAAIKRPPPPIVPPLPLLRGQLFGSPNHVSASGRSYFPNQGGLIMMNGDLVTKTSAIMKASSMEQGGASSSAAMEALLAVEAEVKRLDTLLGAEIASARVVVLGPFRTSSGGEVMSSRLRGPVTISMSSQRANSHRLGMDNSPYHDVLPIQQTSLTPTPVVVTIDHVNTTTQA
jgi:hypothetical protein